MQELITQIQALFAKRNLSEELKTQWAEKLPTLSEENLQDLLAVLQANNKEELDQLQQKNLEKLNQAVTDLKKLTDEGVKLVYQKGEELAREKEEEEGDDLLAELNEA